MTVYNEIFTSFIFSHLEQIPNQRRVLKVLIKLMSMNTGALRLFLLQIKMARFLYFVYVSLYVLSLSFQIYLQNVSVQETHV